DDRARRAERDRVHTARVSILRRGPGRQAARRAPLLTLIGVSLLVFLVAHRRDPHALCLSLFVVLSFYAMTFVLGLSSQLWTAIDVRFLGTLAVLPCLHVALVVGSRRWSWPAQLLCLPQAALIAVACQLRTPAVWTLVCLVGVAAWTVLDSRSRVRPAVEPRDGRPPQRPSHAGRHRT